MAALQWHLTRFSNRFRLGGDALLAVSLASVTAGTALAAGSSVAMRLYGVAAAAGLLVLVERRQRPLLVVMVAFCVVFIEELAAPRAFSVTSFLAIMVASYSLGAYAPRRVLALGMVLGVPGVVLGHSLGKPTHYSDASADSFFFLILVFGPVLVGRIVRARSQLASRLREATERLAAARSERVAATLADDRAQLRERIDAALVDGLGRMVELAQCVTLEQVGALERTAREVLGQLRGLLRDLRGREESLAPSGTVSDLHARVHRALEAEAALPWTPGTAKAPPRQWALMSPRLVDAGLAIVSVVVAGGLLVGTVSDESLRGPRWGDALLAVAVAGPIAWARRYALQATVVSIAATFAYVALAAPADPGSGLLPTGELLVFPLALGATCSARKAIVGLVLCLAAAGLGDAADPAATFHATTVTPGLALVVGAWTAGRLLRDRSRMLSALADTAVAVEDEREQLARVALAAERSRAARELHDAVAHAMTVIVLQAGAARRVWHQDPELAQQHARTLGTTVSELVTELRAMLVALGSSGDAGINRLEQLIERARTSGLHVGLEVTGDRTALAPALQHTAYRVLQEALTNAARHAPGADVLVQLDFGQSGVWVEVSNSTSAPPAPPTDGSGQGLRGMRDRVEACGGRLTAGAQPPDSFAVQAWLPSR